MLKRTILLSLRASPVAQEGGAGPGLSRAISSVFLQTTTSIGSMPSSPTASSTRDRSSSASMAMGFTLEAALG